MTARILVDSNVLPDVIKADPRWGAWSARCHAGYRASGGARTMILPDFLIGAHALVQRMALLTRDARRYKTCFPGLALISPNGA